jgi:hypothetical protein
MWGVGLYGVCGIQEPMKKMGVTTVLSCVPMCVGLIER